MRSFQIQGFFILGPIHSTEIGPIFYYFWQMLKYPIYIISYYLKMPYFSLTSLLSLFPLRSHRSVVRAVKIYKGMRIS